MSRRKATTAMAVLAFASAFFGSANGAAAVRTGISHASLIRRIREATIIVEGRMQVTENSRIERLRPSSPATKKEIENWLKSNGLESAWNACPSGVLKAQIAPTAILKGDVELEGLIHIHFDDGVYFVPPGGVLSPIHSGDILLPSDTASKPFIWVLRQRGKECTSDGSPLSILPMEGSELIRMLADGSSRESVRKAGLGVLSAQDPQAVALGICVVASFRKQEDLGRIIEFLFVRDMQIGEAALKACLAMRDQVNPTILRGLGQRLLAVEDARLAYRAILFVEGILEDHPEIASPPAAKDTIASARWLGSWLVDNAHLLKWDLESDRLEIPESSAAALSSGDSSRENSAAGEAIEPESR